MMNRSEIPINYLSGNDSPWFEASYKVYPNESPLVKFAKVIDTDYPIHIVDPDEKGKQRIQILIKKPLSSFVIKDSILNAWKGDTSIEQVNVVSESDTFIDMITKSKILGVVSDFATRPLHKVLRYHISQEFESFTLCANGSIGKNALLDLEEELESHGRPEFEYMKKLEKAEQILNANINSFKRVSSWITPDDIIILEKALVEGYFDTPSKGINTNQLSELLNIPKSTLNRKLRSINRILADKFIDILNEPMEP